MRTVHPLFLAFAGLLSAGPVAGAQAPAAEEKTPDYAAADEKILRDLKEAVDGPGLLDFFRKRTHPEPDPKRLEALLRQLGDHAFRVREQAHQELIRLGANCLGALHDAEQGGNEEVRRRVRDIRKHIERRADPAAESAAARLIALRKPAGGAAILLNFLPFAADDAVVDEICKALPAVTLHDGKPDLAVLAALKDKLAVKRGAAGAALVTAGAKGDLPAARALLNDPAPAVQLRVALALVRELREKDAVAKLIGVLEQLPPEQLWPAEELLIRLAGDKAPAVSLGTDPAGRQKCRRAWEDWWAVARNDLDLKKVKLDKAFLGYTLVVQRTFNRVVNGKRLPAGGQVQELDANKNVRWKIDVNTYPVHAEVVGHDRVLVAEFSGMRVSERDFKGNPKWEKSVNGNPLAAQRLPNGHTFVVLQNRLLELDAKGNEVYQYDRPMFDIFRGRKLRNGEVVFITAQGVLTRVDPKTNKTLGTFNVGPMGSQFGSFEVLPNGNFLVPVYGTQEVVEFDPKGEAKWRANVSTLVQWPTSAQRLPNGNVLVSSQVSRRIVEIDRSGREVWSHNADGQVFMVHRR
jgi:hypothetical protein